jgi:SNF2 family DNA or RNA helicase
MRVKRNKQSKDFKLDNSGWNTTDADEITRRRLRGQTEKFRIENTSAEPFSSFLVRSKHDKQYYIEIRSLTDHTNSCDCPDYRSNCLGSCKHIEHVLFRLKKAGAKVFKEAQTIGSSRIEIFLDHRDFTIRVYWPRKVNAELRESIDAFFSADGTLIGNPIATYPALQTTLAKNNQELLKTSLRISRHMDHFIERQKQISQKQSAKEIFLKDVMLNKRTLAMTKLPLYPYQQEGMLHLAFTERALLADEMGLGKTVQAIAACELLRRHKNIKRVLVVATASLKAEWEEQIIKFTGLPSLIIVGTRANRLRQYQQSSFFYLTNYEQIVMDGAEIQRLLAPDLIILDEAQRIKNWHTKTANAIKQLKSRYAFVLTGTPLENRIDDVYSIIQFLDPHMFGPLFRFNRDFYELDEKGKPVGYKNLDILHQRLRPIMLRRQKNDVEGQLPPRTVNNYFVKMENEQYVRYAEYKDMVARLMTLAKRRPLRKEELEKLQKWLACMRMLCDTPFILDPGCRVSPKLKELETVLEELLVDDSVKIIVFSEWERMLQLVRELVEKKHLDFAWHTGSVPQHKRRADIHRFKDNPHCRLFLSTDSGSVGLNLQSANVVINLDLPWNPAKLEQRIARAWRKHQTRPVQVINLVCEDSIEHRMLTLLAQKQTLAQGVLEGKDNLKEMKLPSGRAAFMERLESLMGPIDDIVTPIKSALSTTTFDTFLPQMKDHIDLMQSHHNEKTGQRAVLVVTNKQSDEVQQQLQQSLNHEAVDLQILDRQTFEVIQRLAQAGILTLNQPTEILHASSQFLFAQKQIQEKEMDHAKKYLEQALRKQRMAQVLVASEFYEEAIVPLREALELTIHSFVWLIGKAESNKEEILSYTFIQEKLTDKNGLPKNTVALLTQLNSKIDNVHSDHMQTFLTEYHEIFEHVNQQLNNVAMNHTKFARC